MVDVAVEIEGLDKLLEKFDGVPPQLRNAMGRAGKRYAPVVLDQQGVRIYPPLGEGNQPPVPYYVRGAGTQYATFNKGESQKYNQSWKINSFDLQTVVENSATYAKWLAGTYSQARRMASIGWKKLITAVRDTQGQMQKIYSQEVDRGLKELGLK